MCTDFHSTALQRAPTPVSLPETGATFERVFSESIEISDALPAAVVSYRVSGAPEQTCTGNRCAVVLSSSCAIVNETDASSEDEPEPCR
jgi:hypothetical protein